MVVVIVGTVRRYGTAPQLTVRPLIAARCRDKVYATVGIVIVLQQKRAIKTCVRSGYARTKCDKIIDLLIIKVSHTTPLLVV